MCGRVFRKDPAARIKQVVQSRDTELPFTRIVRPTEQHLLTDAGWRSLGAMRALDAEIEATRVKLAQTKTALPAAILKARARSQRSRMGREMD
jgi:hypothetical protein